MHGPNNTALPAALQPLTAQPHWLLWKLEPVKNKKGKLQPGKFTKPPYQADGTLAKSDDPATWATFEAAAQVAHAHSGMGFALLGSGLAAFDIDDCRDANTGVVHPWAVALVEAAGSYTEITPSDTGLRILGYGTAAEVHRKLKVADGVTCELYRQATRYITITGKVYRDAPLANIDAHIDRVLAELEANKDTGKKKKPNGKGERKQKAPPELPQELRLMLYATGDKPASYQSRSELFWAFVCAALRKGLDEQDIINLCLDAAYAGNSIHEHADDNGGQAYVETQIEKAVNDTGTTDSSAKALIRIAGGNFDDAWRKTERALIKAACPVYVRGGAVIQPLWRWEKTKEKNNDMLVCRFVKFNLARLRDVVARHAALFQKFDQREKKWRNINPPNDVIEALLEAGHWGFDTVVGIVNAPTMRPNGTLLTKPGYDPTTQLWYKSAGDIELPPIPERPTKAQAEKALKLLQDLLAGFPFVNDVALAVAIAAIMTVVLRGAFMAAPLFFIKAPEAGTGKSHLVWVTALIASGRRPAALIATPNKDEMEKRLTAAAVEGKPILNLNNLDFDLESAMLSQMITDGYIDIRPFHNNQQTAPCDCTAITVFTNGNNIRVVGDLVRRTLTSEMDAKVEEPETRPFEFDPVDLVKKDRGAYLAAVFTIVRAHMAAGGPKANARTINGFEDWCKWVQQPLLWLGMADPVKSMEGARAMDPVRAALAERLSTLVACFGVGKKFTAAEVKTRALETEADGTWKGKAKYPGLLEAFNTRDGKTIDARVIGTQLVADLNRRSGTRYVTLFKESEKRGNSYQIVDEAAAASAAAAEEQAQPAGAQMQATDEVL